MKYTYINTLYTKDLCIFTYTQLFMMLSLVVVQDQW